MKSRIQYSVHVSNHNTNTMQQRIYGDINLQILHTSIANRSGPSLVAPVLVDKTTSAPSMISLIARYKRVDFLPMRKSPKTATLPAPDPAIPSSAVSFPS